MHDAAGALLLVPLPLLLSPLIIKTIAPDEQMLVLLDVSGIDDLEEQTPRLLHYGMGIQDSDSWRVVVEAVQVCLLLPAPAC